jgi:hypothetical protein
LRGGGSAASASTAAEIPASDIQPDSDKKKKKKKQKDTSMASEEPLTIEGIQRACEAGEIEPEEVTACSRLMLSVMLIRAA